MSANDGKIRILFVDDEKKVLNGLNRMLHKRRKEWDMAFVTSGEEALKLLEKVSADVLISDMRMPGMDGAELLNKVRDKYPETVRVILSGFEKEEDVMRTVGPAQQYLAKPCDAEKISEVIERALKLRTVLGSDKLRALVSGVKELPSPSSVYLKLLKELDSREASSKRLANIIEGDIGLSTQILKLTNSAYFSLPAKVTKPLGAVQLLGFDTIKALVLVSGFFKKFSGTPKTEAALEQLSRRCLLIGALARAIADEEGLDMRVLEQAGCAGVLSHVGTLILLGNWPEKFRQAEDLADEKGIPFNEAEMIVFGASHAEVGGYLLGLWGFSDPVVEAVSLHHKPELYTGAGISPLALVYAAQYLSKTESDPGKNETDAESVEHTGGENINNDYLASIGILDKMPRWAEIAREIINKRE